MKYAGMTSGILLGSSLLGCTEKKPEAPTPSETPQTPTEKTEGGVLVVGQPKELVTLDPIYTSLAAEYRHEYLIFDSLYDQDENGKLVPRLAERTEVTPDGDYIFYIRQGVKFHDGKNLTADDVVYTLESLKNPEIKAELTQIMAGVESVEALDKYTVRLSMETKKATVPAEIGRLIYIVPKHIHQNVTSAEFSANPVGSGPFKVSQIEENVRYEYERFDDYWRTKPKLEKVIIRILPEGAVRVAELKVGGIHVDLNTQSELIEKVKSLPDVRLERPVSIYYIGFMPNLRFEPFDDVRVRRAIQHLFDPVKMVNVVLKGYGQPIYGYSGAPVNIAWNFPVDEFKQMTPEYNPEKAKALLDEAGYIGNPRLSLEIICRPEAHFRKMSEIMQYEMQNIGIDAKVSVMDMGTWLSHIRDPEGFVFSVKGWDGGPDPHLYLYYNGHSKGRPNKGGYSNPEVDKLLEKAYQTFEFEKRRELYIEATKLMLQDLPLIGGYTFEEIQSVSKKVQDYRTSPGSDQILPVVTPYSNVWVKG